MTEVGENEAQRGEMTDAASKWKMRCFLVYDVVSGLACVVGQFYLHSGTFVHACWEEKTRRHHNPLHVLQLMWPLEAPVLVAQGQQEKPKMPSVIAKVAWPTAVISSCWKKHEAKQTCVRNVCVCEYRSFHQVETLKIQHKFHFGSKQRENISRNNLSHWSKAFREGKGERRIDGKGLT